MPGDPKTRNIKVGSWPRSFEGSMVQPIPWYRTCKLLNSQEDIFVVLSHIICCTLLQKSQEMNTVVVTGFLPCVFKIATVSAFKKEIYIMYSD